MKENARLWIPRWAGNGMFEVVGPYDPLGFVDECYSVSTYLRTYENLILPINGKEDWPVVDKPLLHARDVVSRPRRPKKARKRGSDEPNPTKLGEGARLAIGYDIISDFFCFSSFLRVVNLLYANAILRFVRVARGQKGSGVLSVAGFLKLGKEVVLQLAQELTEELQALGRLVNWPSVGSGRLVDWSLLVLVQLCCTLGCLSTS
ncbi:hypothetical protein Dimus_016773 [Dionaea muscipula]